METRIVKGEEGLQEAARLIKSGELVVFPTETVYGLGANAFDEEAVKKIFIAKGRPQDNPLIVHISSLEEVPKLAKDIPELFYTLANKFMPGPITIVLNKSEAVPDIVTAGGKTVGIRMPSNPIANKLIAMSCPIAAPSANKSKHISPTKAEHVYDDLKGEVPLILDGGECEYGIESTVLDLTTDTPTVLRPGAVTVEMLQEVIGDVYVNSKVIKIAKSPGMKYTHYAPKCSCVVAITPESARKCYEDKLKEGFNPVLVYRDIYRDVIHPSEYNFISLGITIEQYEHNIYAALREAEEKYDFIIVENIKEEGLGASVMNRVNKASSNNKV